MKSMPKNQFITIASNVTTDHTYKHVHHSHFHLITLVPQAGTVPKAKFM